MRTYVSNLALSLTPCAVTFGCASVEKPEPVSSGQQTANVTKALYDAMRDDPIMAYDTSKPWPDNYMPLSETYDDCAFSAIPLRKISEDLMPKGLQVFERRYPTESDQ